MSPPAPLQPVVATRVETRTVCPAELLAPLPAAIAVPDGAKLQGSPEALDYVARRFAREGLLGDVIADARLSCPSTSAPVARTPPDG